MTAHARGGTRIATWIVLAAGLTLHARAVQPVGSATSAAGTNRAAAVTWRQMNEAFQLKLWRDRRLWDEDDRDAGQRIGWPEESRTSTLASYRLYANPSVRVLGARPYSLALYGEQGKPTYISMIFANKGDFEGFAMGRLKRATPTPRTLREFKTALEDDERTLEARLRALLGEPTRLTYGEKNLKEKSLRWDWNGHAILLAAPRDEYVGVRLMPPAAADRQGRIDRISDTALKPQLAKNVQRRPNGDVLVTEIPMVDQGPKGFCVPATWERYLRYLGMPADMYVLAMASDTMTGGGTRIDLMVDGIRSYVTRCGRSIEAVHANLSAAGLQKFIDRGLPLMWTLRTSDALADGFTERARQRAQVADWSQWKQSLKDARRKARKLAGAEPSEEGLHLCMIIGYNKDTDEIAISDSWGPEYAERWITVEEAAAMSLDNLMVVSW